MGTITTWDLFHPQKTIITWDGPDYSIKKLNRLFSLKFYPQFDFL